MERGPATRLGPVSFARYTSSMPTSNTFLDQITNPELRAVIDLCHAEVPNFEIRFKDASRWMKFLNFFAQIFNKDFMTRYITTTGPHVYFPSKEYLVAGQDGLVGVLAHELVHMKDRARMGDTRYFLQYAFPQILAVLAVFSIFAIWSPWFLLFLGFLLALAPLPAPGRRDIELDGYTMSMSVSYWQTKNITDAEIEWYAKQFSGAAYYFMWPLHGRIVNIFQVRALSIRTGEVLQNPTFKKVYDIVKPR